MTRKRFGLATLPMARALAAVAMLVGVSAPARSQTMVPPPVRTELDMGGPRFGLTVLSQGSIDALAEERRVTVKPIVSQFGWQFERRLYTNDDGTALLTELVPLVSGLEQGLTLPSVNWLVGLRTKTGTEFGIGPNVTPIGVGLVVAAGVTMRSGALHVPLNFAVARSKSGARVSIMTGFNVRRP